MRYIALLAIVFIFASCAKKHNCWICETTVTEPGGTPQVYGSPVQECNKTAYEIEIYERDHTHATNNGKLQYTMTCKENDWR